MRDVSASAFWEDLYARGADGWEMGRPAPPLVDFIETTPPPRGRVAVPGCGRGHDARFLARHGYDVTGFDFSPAAVAAAEKLARAEKLEATFEPRDIFGLPADSMHAFDGVWEYTCYCRAGATSTWRRSPASSAPAGDCSPASSRFARSRRDRRSPSRAPRSRAGSHGTSASRAHSRRSARRAAARAVRG